MILDDMDHEVAIDPRAGYLERPQQLVARIKRSSKYYYQARSKWFDVRAVNDRSYPWRGNNNDYRTSDLTFGVRLDDGTILDLATGKLSKDSSVTALPENTPANPS